jgi:hypothetical protein
MATCGSYSTTYYPVRSVACDTRSSPLPPTSLSVTAIQSHHANLKSKSPTAGSPLGPPSSQTQVHRTIGATASSQTGYANDPNSPTSHWQLKPEPSSDLHASKTYKSKTDSLEPMNFKPEATGRADINAFVQQFRRGPGILEVSNYHRSSLPSFISMPLGVQGG